MTKCERCGYDHENPGTVEAAVRILACVMPEYNFITRKGKVPKTKDEELQERAQPL
jgi:hypothetical protein